MTGYLPFLQLCHTHKALKNFESWTVFQYLQYNKEVQGHLNVTSRLHKFWTGWADSKEPVQVRFTQHLYIKPAMWFQKLSSKMMDLGYKSHLSFLIEELGMEFFKIICTSIHHRCSSGCHHRKLILSILYATSLVPFPCGSAYVASSCQL